MTIFYDSDGRIVQAVRVGGDFVPMPAQAVGNLWFDHSANVELADRIEASAGLYRVRDGTLVGVDGDLVTITRSLLDQDRSVALSYWRQIAGGAAVQPTTEQLCASLRVLLALVRMGQVT